MLYPLKFTPILKQKIWGGKRILDYFQHQGDGILKDQVGESWDVSAVNNDESVVSNGFLAENSLHELVEIYMSDLVGEEVYQQYGQQFPLLVKLIDAHDNLSIQVHPNEELAQARHGMSGKTEMWYVLDAAPDASIICGFKAPMEKAAYLKHVNNNTLDSTLHKYQVKKGDLFYVPAGCVHSIGAGCLILEVQQASDITYRIFDFNRLQDNGEPRTLHTDLALDAINYDCTEGNRLTPEKVEEGCYKVLESPAFASNLWDLQQEKTVDLTQMASFVLLTCVEGEVNYSFNNQTETLHLGETILIPATMQQLTLAPAHTAKVLQVYMPT